MNFIRSILRTVSSFQQANTLQETTRWEMKRWVLHIYAFALVFLPIKSIPSQKVQRMRSSLGISHNAINQGSIIPFHSLLVTRKTSY